MKKIKGIFALLVLTGALVSCNGGGTNQTTEKSEPAVQEATEHAHEHADEHGIKLNNGEKWKVNEEMKPFVLDAQAALKDYIATRGTNHKSLAEKLQDQNSGLIEGCTMTGESHEELHKWLHPHLQLVDSLAKVEDGTVANELISQIDQSFQTYNTYFQ